MNRILLVAALLASVGALVVASAAYREATTVRDEVRVRDVRRESDAGQAQVSARPEGASAAVPASAAADGATAPATSASSAPSVPTASVLPEEALRAAVRQFVAEEMEARAAAAAKEGPAGESPDRESQGGEEKKPPLSQVAATLGLDERQREAMRETVVRGQREVIEMLRQPMADGKVPIAEIFDVFLDEPEKAKARAPALFGMLLTEKIPGTDETYGQRWEDVKRRTAEGFARDLSAEQFREYEKLGLDPLEIQVTGSPWMEVLQQEVARRKR